MSVARILCPQLLDEPLRPSEEPVDVQAVGVGGHLLSDPRGQPHQRGRQRLAHPEDPLERCEAHLRLLADRRATLGALGLKQHAGLGQLLLEPTAAVGQVSEEPAGDGALLKASPRQKLAHQEYVRGVGGAKFVGDGHAVGRADEVQLHPVHREGAPPYPRSSLQTARLPHLPGLQDRKQSRVDDQGLGVPDQLGEHDPAQGLQEAPKPPHPSVERGRVQPHDSREQVREKPLGIAQERALALDASQLPEEGQRDDLRVREPLYGLVASGARVEVGVCVVYEAEEGDDRLFRSGEAWGMVLVGHPELLWSGVGRTALFLSQPTPQHTSSRTVFSPAVSPGCAMWRCSAMPPSIMSPTNSCSLVSFRSAAPTVLPLRSTVALSAIWKISSMRCEIKMRTMPRAFHSPPSSKSRSTCRPPRLAVASSKIMTRGSRLNALRISTICRSLGERADTRASGPTEGPSASSKRERRRAVRSFRSFLRTRPKATGSLASQMFSATVMSGTRLSSW